MTTQSIYTTLRKISFCLCAVLWTCISPLSGQTERLDHNKAFRAYKNKKYPAAQALFRKTITAYPQSVEPALGMAMTFLRTNNTAEGLKQLEQLAQRQEQLSPQMAARIWHNIGNVHMGSEDYPKAIEAYKQSLRMNPTDHETRYNLALALKLNKEDPSGGGGGGGGSSQDQQQNQDQQNQQQHQQTPPTPEMSKEQAEKLLEAYRKDQDETRKKIEQRQEKTPPPPSQKKNW